MTVKVKRILTHILCFILGALIGAGVYGAVDHITAQPNLSGEFMAESAGGMQIGNGDNHGVQLTSVEVPVENYDEYGISPIAESAYTLTATVTPAESTVKDFTWSIKFKNPSSSWASGKNISDYLTLSPDSSDKLKCTVSCNAAFGEPAEVSITYDYDSTIKATVQVDYVKRIQNISVSGFSASTFCDSSKTNTLQLSATYGVGTVTGNLKIKSAWGELNTDFFNDITGSNEQAGYYYGQAETLNGVNNFSFWETSKKAGKAVSTNKLSLNVNSFLTQDIPEANLNYLKAAFVMAANASDNGEHLRVAVEYEYSYSTFSTTGTVYTAYGQIDTSKLSNPYTITGVSIDQDGLYY